MLKRDIISSLDSTLNLLMAYVNHHDDMGEHVKDLDGHGFIKSNCECASRDGKYMYNLLMDVRNKIFLSGAHGEFLTDTDSLINFCPECDTLNSFTDTYRGYECATCQTTIKHEDWFLIKEKEE